MPKANFFNNTGGLNKFCSETTLNDSETKTDWADAQNVESYKSGGIIKMNGNINIIPNLLANNTKILGVFDYIKQNNHYPVVTTSEGILYRLDPDKRTLTSIYTGLSATARCTYANYNNGVIVTNGVNTPVFYEEGSIAVPLTGSAPIGGVIEVYKSRVFIAKDSTLYYCALGNQNDWTTVKDAGYISNFHNDSSPITALKNYGEYLAIYKNDETYIMSGTSPDDFLIKPIADRGTPSVDSVCNVDNNQFFFDGSAVFPLRFNELGQIRVADDISIKIKPLLAELDMSKFSQVVSLPYAKKSQIWFYFASKTSSILDICYIYDYMNNAWYLRKGLPITCAAVINGTIYSGTADGRILKEDFGDTFDGAHIEAWWYSPWFTFGNTSQKKEINDFSVWLYQSQKMPVDIVFSKDFDIATKKKLPTFAKIVRELLWDQGNWTDFMWAMYSLVRKKINIGGKCEAVQVGVESFTYDEPFIMTGYSFEFTTAEL